MTDTHLATVTPLGTIAIGERAAAERAHEEWRALIESGAFVPRGRALTPPPSEEAVAARTANEALFRRLRPISRF